MAAPVRRRKMLGRRRADDEGEDEGGPDQFDMDDDSLTEGSLASDDDDLANDSDTSNIEEASPTTPAMKKSGGRAAASGDHRNAKSGGSRHADNTRATETAASTKTVVPDAQTALNGLNASEHAEPVQELDFDAVNAPSKSAAPIVVSSSSATADPDNLQNGFGDKRRREHDEYRKKRDEDPSFVPNRGAFFMHDHRHAGPSANGFRPFGRGGRGRGRGIGGPFAPINQRVHNPADPTTNPWAHDMHEVVADPVPTRAIQQLSLEDGPANGDGVIPTCAPNATPINRTLSTEKHIGNVQVRVLLQGYDKPIVYSGVPVKQYTKLPDHRPPLRRDKPVRISLPDFGPRYIFPATDRSFIFIPRAMRPNQQRLRGKPRSTFGSIGGFSRRTSVFGGSYYGGSTYSPSIALSRRSSIAPDMGRDYLASPTGSAISRPPLALDNARPVVRLPPQQYPTADGAPADRPIAAMQSTINDLPQPQTHPLPQKPAFQENRPTSLPMHQPRPQKAVSLENIEAPSLQQNPPPYQQAFHQQVPVQVANGMHGETHTRNLSYPSQLSTGTPLSQIPERAIHAAPFQPTQFSQPNYYQQPYQVMQPQPQYYYPPTGAPAQYPPGAAPSGGAPPFGPGPPQAQGEVVSNQGAGQPPSGPSIISQELDGAVYYYDAAQLPNMPVYPSYPTPQGYPMPMNNMVNPNPEGYYYPQGPGGVVYYPQ